MKPIEFNYRAGDAERRAGLLPSSPSSMPGTSCFLRDGDRVFHTYSSYARGAEWTGGSYAFLDLTALGRQEDWEEPKGRADHARGQPARLRELGRAPGALRGGAPGEVPEVARGAAERALDAVGESRVAAVEDLGEQVAQQRDDVGGDAMAGELLGEVRVGDRREADVPAGGVGDLADRVGEREQPRPGQLVELPGVAVLRERGDGDVGDVVGVDERLGHVADRQRDLAGQHGLAQVVLAEVLAEPAAADDGPVGAGGLQLGLGALRLLLAATREQHEAARSAGDGEPRQLGDGLGRAGHGDVGEVRDVRGRGAAQRGRPGRAVVPVERRLAAAGADAHGRAALLQARHHAAARLAGAAEDEDG